MACTTGGKALEQAAECGTREKEIDIKVGGKEARRNVKGEHRGLPE
jgi:hypothetical protein